MLSRRRPASQAASVQGAANSKQVPPTINAASSDRRSKRRRSLGFLVCFATVPLCLLVFNVWGHSKIVSQTNSQHSSIVTITQPNLAVTTQQKGDPTTTQRKPTNQACDGFRGVYHVEKGDIGGAAGTVFFQFVIGQLIWAEKYNFKPWVFLNNVSYVIYDPIVHGRGPGMDFQMLKGMNISYIQRPNGHWRDAYPGPPENGDGLVPAHFHFDGNGVWEDYFEPVSDFVPGDTSCRNKPLVTMDLYQVTPGVHGFAPWAPRCWRYQYLPDYVTKPHIPLSEWLEPQRHLANGVLHKYIRFLPHIRESAQQVNPSCSLENSCLGIHIRQSDKAAGRRQIGTDEFLPYAQAFVEAGGRWIYLATDSGKVIDQIREHWPKNIQHKIRSMGDNVVRSNDMKAVFDIASHHRTNTEILIEILALSYCQFMVHGLSAVTETSIWINVDLHYTSVNLEDPDHLDPSEFGHMTTQVLRGGNATQINHDRRTSNWWNGEPHVSPTPSDTACNDVNGVLHIQYVGIKAQAGFAFFTSVLNQLYYAERYSLKPWIHLSSESEYIYDADFHGTGTNWNLEGMVDDLGISLVGNRLNSSLLYPGEPSEKGTKVKRSKHLSGNGVWNSYFEPVSDFVPGDKSCASKPLVSIDSEMVSRGLNSFCPWSIKPWRYDEVPDDLWKPENATQKSWYEPMRRKAHELIKKYYKFKPHIIQRAMEVNPANETPCLAVHFRNSDKGKNKFRKKFPVPKYRDYLVAFARAGGKTIYIATDSHRALEYIDQHFPWHIRKMIRTQGPYVVRSTSKWPIHFLEKHHRTNTEVMVDILAMSKCQLLLHGNSAVSEAAIYLNLKLHNQSVNWEDPDKLSTNDFEALARQVLGTEGAPPEDPGTPEPGEEKRPAPKQYEEPAIIKGSSDRQCKRNAIVYLAQKRHSSYDRDSYGILLESLKLMYRNYLSLDNHGENTDLIIFHTGDFTNQDLDALGERFGSKFRNLLQLVDLTNTTYWKRPAWHEGDDPFKWYAFPLFSEGYRRMMHWFAIDIWQFFEDHEKRTGCKYEYIMRFDEDSFLRSKIEYDIFDFMKQHDYNYGFRLCSYEMQVTQRIWKLWRKSKGSPVPIRDIELEMCGVYNNFFVAKLSFFRSPQVKKFLHFVDRQGMIYRRRLGDLMIHSMTIYAFAQQQSIHRFLDFTYEHATVDKESGCVVWGGIQAGYDDPNADATIENFYQTKVAQKGCQANLTLMSKHSLSPTYAHLPDRLNGKIGLKTIMAGRVEVPGKGLLSG